MLFVNRAPLLGPFTFPCKKYMNLLYCRRHMALLLHKLKF